MSTYTARLVAILQEMTTRQAEVLDPVAESCADALERGN
jgi:hypothetical protein